MLNSSYWLELLRELFHNPFSQRIGNHIHMVFHGFPSLGLGRIFLFVKSINLCYMVTEKVLKSSIDTIKNESVLSFFNSSDIACFMDSSNDLKAGVFVKKFCKDVVWHNCLFYRCP